MSTDPAGPGASAPAGPKTATLGAPVPITGPKEHDVLEVGFLDGGPAGVLGVLGAVLTVDELAPNVHVTLRWRVRGADVADDRAPRTPVARLEGFGPSRLLAALDTDAIPAGISRAYVLTVQLAGGVLVGRVAAAMARAGTTARGAVVDPATLFQAASSLGGPPSEGAP